MLGQDGSPFNSITGFMQTKVNFEMREILDLAAEEQDSPLLRNVKTFYQSCKADLVSIAMATPEERRNSSQELIRSLTREYGQWPLLSQRRFSEWDEAKIDLEKMHSKTCETNVDIKHRYLGFSLFHSRWVRLSIHFASTSRH